MFLKAKLGPQTRSGFSTSGFHNVPGTSTQDITNEMLCRIISQLDNVQEHCGLPKLQILLFTNVLIQKLANVFLMLAVQAD
jgi:hypothetical protein